MKSIIFLIIMMYLVGLSHSKANITTWEKYRRTKRSLVFHNGGSLRLGFGISVPVRLYDRVPYRQLLILYNLLAGYDLPSQRNWQPVWLARTLDGLKETYEKYQLYKDDRLRTLLYTILEVQISLKGRNGRECLKRAICENGHYADNQGLWAEIIHEVLRPSKYNSDKEYIDAYEIGKFSAECVSAFPDCKIGDSFLDHIIFIKEFS